MTSARQDTVQKIVIIGATSAIAEHCARLWVERQVDLTLVGRDPARTEAVAADLRVRSPQSAIHTMTTNFIDPAAIARTVADIVAHGLPHTVLLAHGYLPDQLRAQQDLNVCSDALMLNGISPVLFAEAFAQAFSSHLQPGEEYRLAIIGSVAGDRGRKSNYVYGAAKGLITRYAQGLQHRFAGTGLRVVLIKPGPTDTPMTVHLKRRGARLAGVEDVARVIVGAVAQGKRVVYAPGKWRLVMAIIRHLPNFIFDRMDV